MHVAADVLFESFKFMNSFSKKCIVLFASLLALFLPRGAMLASSLIPLPQVIQDPTVAGVAGLLFKFLWEVFSAFSAVMFLVAAFLFVTSGSDSTKMTIAKNALIGGVIGTVCAIVSASVPFIVRSFFS